MTLSDRQRAIIIKNSMLVLLLGQIVIIGYLLAMKASDVVMLLSLSVLPLLLICNLLMKIKSRDKYGEMSLIMFAAGGFGMLLGSVLDMGQLGPYAFLSYCRANNLSTIFFDGDKLAQFLNLMPWSFIGMLVMGNLAMMLFDSMGMHRNINVRQYVTIYLVCNIGMLMGMFAGEAAASVIDMGVGVALAAAGMMVMMILGMTLGMLVLLYLMMNVLQLEPKLINE